MLLKNIKYRTLFNFTKKKNSELSDNKWKDILQNNKLYSVLKEQTAVKMVLRSKVSILHYIFMHTFDLNNFLLCKMSLIKINVAKVHKYKKGNK